MPIEVKHGGGIDALAGLLRGQGQYATRESQLRGQDFARIYDQQSRRRSAREGQRAQAGIAAANNAARRSMHAQSLQAQRQRQMQQIDAQTARDKQAADTAYKRAAVGAGLQSELQEQAFDQRIQAMEEQARIEAQKTKLEYSMETKREMAKDNAARNFVANSDDYSEGEKAQIFKQLDSKKYHLDKLPDNRQKPPKGKEPFSSGLLQDGRPFFINQDGSMTVGKFSDTKAGVETADRIKKEEAASKERKERVDKQREWSKDRSMYVLKRTQDTGDDSENISVRQAGREFDAARPMLGPGSPFRQPEDDSPARPTTPQAPQAPAAPAAYEGPWFENPALKGMEITEADKTLEPEVGSFLVMTREKSKEWKDKKMSPAMKQAMADAIEKLRRAGVGTHDMKLHQ